MAETIWKKCNGIEHIRPLNQTAWRVIEAQHIVATRKLVDSLEEQEILEELIESNKPPIKEDSTGLHYLLYTPFRYPPLKNGSRFGTKYEPSLWYGSLELDTALAETAFYRFNFIRASKVELGTVESSHSVFSAQIKTEQGIDLTQSPFSEFTSIISSSESYQASQLLGTNMRQNNIEAFFYQSARDINKKNNIALFTPKAFSNKKPVNGSFQSWQCIINQNVADFIRVSSATNETRSFQVDSFMSNGVLPFPAN